MWHGKVQQITIRDAYDSAYNEVLHILSKCLHIAILFTKLYKHWSLSRDQSLRYKMATIVASIPSSNLTISSNVDFFRVVADLDLTILDIQWFGLVFVIGLFNVICAWAVVVVIKWWMAGLAVSLGFSTTILKPYLEI